jgi:hypothetical protein
VLGNRQTQASAEDLARAGEPSEPGKDLPILQEIRLDGGDGVFLLLYLLRLRSAGGFEADPRDVFSGEGRRKGDVVALSGRMLEAGYRRDRELFDLAAALARLASPDWRVARTAVAALLPEGGGVPEGLWKRGIRLLAKAAGEDERTLCLYALQGLPGPAYSPAALEGAEAGKRIAFAYAGWFAAPGPEEEWRKDFDAFLAAVSEPGRGAGERAERFAAGLWEFGHGSPLPRTTTDLENPRSYVKAFSPRLQDWCAAMFEGRHPDAPLVAVAVAAGADPFLRAQFMERGREGFLRALVPGLAAAPPLLRLRALAWLEQATGCVFPRFDPFGSGEAAEAEAKAMADRFERTGFRARGEEAERKVRIAAARRALESLAVMQRKLRAEKKAWSADLGEVLRAGFGTTEAAEPSGFLRDASGRWALRAGFALDLALAGEGFRMTARGRIAPDEPETAFRFDSAAGTVEMLP